MGKFIYILPFFLLIFFVFPAGATVKSNPFVLVIDPGHGGKDTGALGKKGKEKDINLAVATLLGQYIAEEHPDVKIVYTRKKDVFIGLDDRADIANKANANLFISIHTNSVAKRNYIRGAEVYTFGVTRIEENLEVAKRENSVILMEDDYEQKYEGFDPNSAESYIIFEFMVNLYADQSINFASMTQKELVKTAKRGNRGVKQAAYLVLRKSTMPRILIELDFISNRETEDFLLTPAGQRSLARSISNAFTEYKKEFDRKEGVAGKENPSAIFVRQEREQKQQEQVPDVSTEVAEQRPVQTAPVQTTPVQTTPVQTAPVQTAPTQTVPTQTTPTQTIPVQTTPVQTDSTHEKPATAKESIRSRRVYKVQVLASLKKLPDKSPALKGYKVECYTEDNYYKYTYGESSDRNEIDSLKKKISKDFKDAFIVTFENGVKVVNK